MSKSQRSLIVALAGLVAVLALSLPAEAQSLIGEWKLVEQTYGRGQSNLVRSDAGQVRLRFVREATGIRGRILGGEHATVEQDWPRLSSDDARTVHLETTRFSEIGDEVTVSYRVDPSPGDDLTLEVTEQYRVEDDGQALVGTVRIRFVRDGQRRGEYLLHRRFERER